MKIVFVLVAVVLALASIVADYKWRQWMAARRAEREALLSGDPGRRDRE